MRGVRRTIGSRGRLLPAVAIKAMLPRSGSGGEEMFDDLTNSQVALLCDIGEYVPSKLSGDQKRDLERLLSEGYVEPTESHPGSAFMLTAKGAEFLGMRGAGLNEA
jgi:hypothetical protein